MLWIDRIALPQDEGTLQRDPAGAHDGSVCFKQDDPGHAEPGAGRQQISPEGMVSAAAAAMELASPS